MKGIMTMIVMLGIINTYAQSDSTKIDTIKSGNFVIIKKNKTESKLNSNREVNFEVHVNIDSSNKKKCTNANINWLVMDLGFANYRDNSNYSSAIANGYVDAKRPVDANSMGLNGGKSSNVNLWLFMQRYNLIKKIVNVKYGFGLEMYNFRFDKSISYRKNPTNYVELDSIGFSKDKLYTGYLTVPFMLNFNLTPNKSEGLSFSAGVSAGYLVGSHLKQISSQRGKEKYKSNFNLNTWKLAAIAELGLGPIRLYGSYSFSALHKDITGLEQYPYSVGVRFSKW